jgi:predicted GNAT superfamily acetyltransferase
MLTNLPAATLALIDDARQVAAQACEEANLRVVPVDSPQASRDVVEILDGVWGKGPASLPVHLVRALADNGNYVVGLQDIDHADVLIGASVGFFSDPATLGLHSHITGIMPDQRGRHVGTALKLDQRAWALERGIQAITWTFDPLISRNAHFNLVRLGARADSYHKNFYGPMADIVNQNDATDRIHVTWALADPWTAERTCPVVDETAHVVLEVGERAEPVSHDLAAGADLVCVGVPRDIETIRQEAPSLAQWWRQAIGDTFGTLMDRGYEITGFSNQSQYLFRSAT